MPNYVQLAILVVIPVLGQPQAPPAFEVASVKPTQHGRNAEGWSHSSVDIPSPGRLVAENSSLDELIRFAYRLKDYQVSGPVWLNDDAESFDVVAKAPPDTPRQHMRGCCRRCWRSASKWRPTAKTKCFRSITW
jgi:hypothetical protein